jgi:hypothetical protein
MGQPAVATSSHDSTFRQRSQHERLDITLPAAQEFHFTFQIG